MVPGAFLYYAPRKKLDDVTRSFVAERPESVPFFDLVCSPRLFSLHIQRSEISNGGPDGGAGAIFAAQPVVDVPTQRIGYFPEHQKWERIGEQWIGLDTTHPPGPDSLRRITMIAGIDTEMGDGQIWQAPILRPWHEQSRKWGSAFPTVIKIGADGTRGVYLDQRYAKLWQTSGTIGAYLFDGLPASELDLFSWAVECLGVNYRISEPEASILELGKSQAVLDVIRTAVDENLVRFMKSPDPSVTGDPTLPAGETNT